MKNTISKKITKVILIPFLIVFGVLLTFIAYSVTHYVNNWTELELKGISEINAADLAGRMYSVQVSVLSSANMLDILDKYTGNGRELAESIIKSMFENQYVYNSWLACEPDAFDENDADHKSDYPGAPSGRFIRSYILEDNQIVTAPDMDEATLDDPDQSPWYVIPRDTDQLYIDIDNEIPNLYDYGLGDEPVYTLSIVAPIHKDGRVIGCVGADVLFDVTTFGIDNSEQAAVAVFYPNGRLFYSQDLAFAEESVDTLHFTESEKIKEAMSNGHSLFLPDEYSVFLDAPSFTYFQPVGGGNSHESSLFLYTAKPVAGTYSELLPVFFLIGAVAAAVMILGLSMFVYISRKITKPLRSLTLAADAISQGDLETEIASFTEAKDEIGVLSQSLHRMVEQFRVYIIRLEQTQGEMAIFSRLDDFTKAENTADALRGLTEMLRKQFGVSKATAVFMDGGRAREFSDGDCPDFMYHTQVEAMLTGKKLLYMNTGAITQMGVGFLDRETLAAYILPIWTENDLCGYIIFESNSKKRTMNFSTEAILTHVAKTLANWWIKNREMSRESTLTEPVPVEPVEPAAPAAPQETAATKDTEMPDASPTSVFKTIPGLDADSAVAAMGGLSEIYMRSITLMTRLLPETEEKLSRYLTEDINAFAIEIHGLKGSLNNIGAYALGGVASRIEQMAKAGDRDGCLESFPSFRASISELYRNITAVLKEKDEKPPGDTNLLAYVLEKAGEAIGSFDTLEALDIMRTLASYAYETETETLINEVIYALEAFNNEDASEKIQTLKGRILL